MIARPTRDARIRHASDVAASTHCAMLAQCSMIGRKRTFIEEIPGPGCLRRTVATPRIILRDRGFGSSKNFVALVHAAHAEMTTRHADLSRAIEIHPQCPTSGHAGPPRRRERSVGPSAVVIPSQCRHHQLRPRLGHRHPRTGRASTYPGGNTAGMLSRHAARAVVYASTNARLRSSASIRAHLFWAATRGRRFLRGSRRRPRRFSQGT